mmetsp:Transcript_29624/g.85075  ORF Transcript_29624/g.85075 Transcript_29624/m.85075 type:complete len:211 (-) Transcript_29624:746-1378(-)
MAGQLKVRCGGLMSDRPIAMPNCAPLGCSSWALALWPRETGRLGWTKSCGQRAEPHPLPWRQWPTLWARLCCTHCACASGVRLLAVWLPEHHRHGPLGSQGADAALVLRMQEPAAVLVPAPALVLPVAAHLLAPLGTAGSSIPGRDEPGRAVGPLSGGRLTGSDRGRAAKHGRSAAGTTTAAEVRVGGHAAFRARCHNWRRAGTRAESKL